MTTMTQEIETGVAQLNEPDDIRPRWRGFLHQVSFCVFVPLVVFLARDAHDGAARAAAIVYGVCLLSMLGVSALYHRFPWAEAGKRRMRRLDHSTILLSIAGGYTPFIVEGLSGATQKWAMAVIWSATLAGVLIRNLWLDCPRWISNVVYLTVGWIAVFLLPTFYRSLGPVVFGLVLGGGVLYSLGAVVYARKKPNPWPAHFGFHEIFHTFVVAAAGLHFAAAYIVLT